MADDIGLQEATTSAERRAHVMGTEAHVIVVADDAGHLADVAIARLQRLEARWSRFLPCSEISRLNNSPGVPVLVTPETFRLIDHALTAWQMTDGSFDPTILGDLRAEGYDRSFELLADADAPSSPMPTGLGPSPRPSRATARPAAPDIRLDHVVGTVRLGPNTTFDPGGIGKGLAADLVVAELLSSGARGALVSIGGDLRAAGDTPEGGPWVVSVVDPLEPEHALGDLALEAGAVASSWRTKRTWTGPDGQPRHHLIDPRTGRSATSGAAGVTVVAAQGWRAEVLAKAAFLAGPQRGPALIAAWGAAGIVVADDGSVHPAGDIEAFLERVGPRVGASRAPAIGAEASSSTPGGWNHACLDRSGGVRRERHLRGDLS
jgi:thiamine biosynthesis lipoprotein